jgi:hypothetical protein
MTSESNISNQKNTGGNFSFGAPGTGVSPVPSQFNGTYKNDSNGDITALTGDIVAKLSNDCTIVGTVKAKLGTF